jgi:hypothetical protein
MKKLIECAIKSYLDYKDIMKYYKKENEKLNKQYLNMYTKTGKVNIRR